MSTRKLVHKQFNSPIGLYSQQNVKETLNRELKAFGSDGIEIDEQIAKPLNLANSAVLRAVEEEDQQIKCGYKRVAWPPVSEERIVREFTPQPAVSAAAPPSAAVQPEQYRASSYDKYQQPQQQQQQYQSVYQQQHQQPPSWAHHQQQQQYQPPTAPQYQPQVESINNNNNNYNNNNYYSQQQQQQQPNYQTHPYNVQQNQANQASYDSYSQFQQQHQQTRAQSLSQDQVDQYNVMAQSLPQGYRGGSPGIIQLRKEAPVTQKPAPVYTSQPAAVSFQGGSNMRGDLKWPPPEYKEAAAKENEERRKLALGPVCRPRKVHRDYSSFFAKNAINSYYPSYKTPPGTQHMLA